MCEDMQNIPDFSRILLHLLLLHNLSEAKFDCILLRLDFRKETFQILEVFQYTPSEAAQGQHCLNRMKNNVCL